VKNYGDERQSAWCVHCGTTTKGSRDHIPSKAFLDRPYPPNLPTLDICTGCNRSFSHDEEYTACFLECVVCGTTEPGKLERQKIAKALQANPQLRKRIAQSENPQLDLFEQLQIWEPEWNRISNVLLKNARGHVLYELNEPAPREQPDHAFVAPLHSLRDQQRNHFEKMPEINVWPEVGSRAFQRIATGEGLENGWVIVQPRRYRYQATAGGWLMIKLVVREYLAAEFIWL
jgi:hypothetical protein